MNHLTSDTPAADALLSLLLALFLGGVMWLVWLTAAGRFAQEPSPVTTAVAPGSTPVIATIEEP